MVYLLLEISLGNKIMTCKNLITFSFLPPWVKKINGKDFDKIIIDTCLKNERIKVWKKERRKKERKKEERKNKSMEERKKKERKKERKKKKDR